MKKNKKIPMPLVDKEWRGCAVVVVPIFKQVVYLFVGDKQQMYKHLWKNRKDGKVDPVNKILANSYGEPDACDNVEVEGVAHNNGAYSIIRMPFLDIGDMNCINSLYHEALHVALVTMNRTGAEIGEGGETLAYLQGYIVSSLLSALKNGACSTILPDGTKINPKMEEIVDEIRKGLV